MTPGKTKLRIKKERCRDAGMQGRRDESLNVGGRGLEGFVWIPPEIGMSASATLYPSPL